MSRICCLLLLLVSLQSCEHSGDTTSYIQLPTSTRISLAAQVANNGSYYHALSDVHGILASGETHTITRYGDSTGISKQRWVAGNFQNTKQLGGAPGTIYLNSRQYHFQGADDIQKTDTTVWNTSGINKWQISGNAAASRAFDVAGDFPTYKGVLPVTLFKDRDLILEFNTHSVQHADNAFLMLWNMHEHYLSPVADARNGRIVIPADKIKRLHAHQKEYTKFNLVLFSNRIHPYGLKHIATPVVSEYVCWVEIK